VDLKKLVWEKIAFPGSNATCFKCPVERERFGQYARTPLRAETTIRRDKIGVVCSSQTSGLRCVVLFVSSSEEGVARFSSVRNHLTQRR
jgi:hypothetical protein